MFLPPKAAAETKRGRTYRAEIKRPLPDFDFKIFWLTNGYVWGNFHDKP